MSIRGRLLTLAVGGVVPLLIVGLIGLWAVWNGKQQHARSTRRPNSEHAPSAKITAYDEQGHTPVERVLKS